MSKINSTAGIENYGVYTTQYVYYTVCILHSVYTTQCSMYTQ